MNKLKKIFFMLLATVGLIFSLVACGNFFNPTKTTLEVIHENGEVSGTKASYNKNEEVTLEAFANEGYSFIGWFENDCLIELDSTLKIKVNNQVIVALFSDHFGSFIHLDDKVYFITTSDNLLDLNNISIPGSANLEISSFYIDSNYLILASSSYTLTSNLNLYCYSSNYVLITFLNYDSSVFSNVLVKKGDELKFDLIPTRPSDNTYTYTFSSWDRSFEETTSNTSYTAQYNQTFINYEITFITDIFSTQIVLFHYNDPITFDESSLGESFLGWSLSPYGGLVDLGVVTGNKTFYAIYQVIELLSIEVVESPYITTYYNDATSLDLNGLVVKAYYSDDLESILDISEYSVDSSNVNFSVGGSYEVSISYTHWTITKTTSFNVLIIEIIPVSLEILQYPSVLEYYIDANSNNFTSSGLVTKVTYNNETSGEVTPNIDLSGVIWNQVGSYDVSVSYTYNLVSVSEVFQISIYTLG
jgi:hypothetical protein